jgi:4-hydroxybenzoyl-CoA reductase subunit beta
MLRLPSFTYLAPKTLAEAVDLLGEHGASAMVVAGGTDLYPSMKRQLFTPATLIGLRGVTELQQIVVGGAEEGVTLGAGVTLTALTKHPMLMQRYPILAQAAQQISTPQLRNMGTLGGNLCLDTRCTYYNQSEEWRQALGYCMKKKGHTCWVAPGSDHCLAVQSSDLAPVLIALDAEVQLVGPTGTRRLPLAALYQNDGIAYLTKRRDEILTAVQLPPSSHLRATYQKLRRRGAFDFPVLSIAVALTQDPSGICTAARVVISAVASAPLRVSAAEAGLVGNRLTDDVLTAAAECGFAQAKPLDNTDLTLAYRKQMARVYTLRALRELRQSDTY